MYEAYLLSYLCKSLFLLPYLKGIDILLLKNAIIGPIKNAVTRVPIPTVAPSRKPMIVQIRSEPILQYWKGATFFSANINATAS